MKTERITAASRVLAISELPTELAIEGVLRLGRVLGDGAIALVEEWLAGNKPDTTRMVRALVTSLKGLDPKEPARDVVWLFDAFELHTKEVLSIVDSQQRGAQIASAFSWRSLPLGGVLEWAGACLALSFADFFGVGRSSDASGAASRQEPSPSKEQASTGSPGAR